MGVRPNDGDDEEDVAIVHVVEERPPLRVGKIFVDFDERATIGDSLEAAYVALDYAFRGIWIEKSLQWGPASRVLGRRRYRRAGVAGAQGQRRGGAGVADV